jgi:deoxyribodipyrimidine photo-lyase
VPGEAAARGLLHDFVSQRLRFYESRNDPGTPQGLSGLSPYLHFGQLSAQRAALEVNRARAKLPKAVDGFIEEAVVRRELSDNFCWYPLTH